MIISLASLIFRIINSLIIGSLVVYFIRKNFLPSLRKERDADQIFIDSLRKQELTLIKKVEEIEQAIVHEEKEQGCLKLTIDQWRKQVTKKEEEFAQHKELIKKAMQMRVEMQTAYLKMRQEQKNTVPLALAGAKEDLHKIFADKHKGKIFIQQIIGKMGNL